ncbi:hypothetical protein MXD98_16550, partial [Legionella pneumophila]|nr:hypothetical protein [Legionella pneumophila]
DYLTRSMSEYQTGSPEYDFIFKFLFGTAILGYCALNRITDRKFTSQVELSAAVASELPGHTIIECDSRQWSDEQLIDFVKDADIIALTNR